MPMFRLAATGSQDFQMRSPKIKTMTTTRERALALAQRFRKVYPDAHCELNFTNPLELLIATILSAQCTDVRVNQVTSTLSKKYRSADEFAGVDQATLEDEIRATGFFRQKAMNVRRTAKIIADDYDGEVPQSMEQLTKLPAVARKTANVVLGTAYEI